MEDVEKLVGGFPEREEVPSGISIKKGGAFTGANWRGNNYRPDWNGIHLLFGVEVSRSPNECGVRTFFLGTTKKEFRAAPREGRELFDETLELDVFRHRERAKKREMKVKWWEEPKSFSVIYKELDVIEVDGHPKEVVRMYLAQEPRWRGEALRGKNIAVVVFADENFRPKRETQGGIRLDWLRLGSRIECQIGVTDERFWTIETARIRGGASYIGEADELIDKKYKYDDSWEGGAAEGENGRSDLAPTSKRTEYVQAQANRQRQAIEERTNIEKEKKEETKGARDSGNPSSGNPSSEDASSEDASNEDSYEESSLEENSLPDKVSSASAESDDTDSGSSKAPESAKAKKEIPPERETPLENSKGGDARKKTNASSREEATLQEVKEDDASGDTHLVEDDPERKEMPDEEVSLSEEVSRREHEPADRKAFAAKEDDESLESPSSKGDTEERRSDKTEDEGQREEVNKERSEPIPLLEINLSVDGAIIEKARGKELTGLLDSNKRAIRIGDYLTVNGRMGRVQYDYDMGLFYVGNTYLFAYYSQNAKIEIIGRGHAGAPFLTDLESERAREEEAISRIVDEMLSRAERESRKKRQKEQG